MYFKKLLAFSTAITLSLGAFAPSLHAVNPGEDEEGDSPTLSTHDPDHDPTAELALSKIKRYIATWTGNHPTDRQNDTEKFIQRFINAVTTADNATFIGILTTIRNTESLDRKLTSSRFSRDQIYDKIQNILGEKTDKDELIRDIIRMRSDARPKKTGPEDTTPRATEETEFYTNIKFFVERLSTLADIFRPTSTPSDAGTTKTRKRRHSHSPTHTAKPRTQSPVKEEAATPTPATPKAATRHRAKPVTHNTTPRALSPVIPVSPVVPEPPTRHRARSVTPVVLPAPVIPELTTHTPRHRAKSVTSAAVRSSSLSPTRTAEPHTEEPKPAAAAAPAPTISETQTRHRAKSMTSATKHRSQAPKIQSEDAPTTAVIPETMANKDEKTRRRAGSVVLPDYRAESKEFIKPLREHAGDWKAHYGSYIVSDSTGIEGCIDALCKALCEDEQFVNAFHMSWRHNRVYIKDSLTNTDYEHLRMVIANILDKDPPQRKVLLRAIFDCTMKAITEGNIAASSFYFNAHSVLGHMDDLFPKRPAK